MFKSLLGIVVDVARVVTAPVEIAVDLTRAITKPVAEAASDVVKVVKDETQKE